MTIIDIFHIAPLTKPVVVLRRRLLSQPRKLVAWTVPGTGTLKYFVILSIFLIFQIIESPSKLLVVFPKEIFFARDIRARRNCRKNVAFRIFIAESKFSGEFNERVFYTEISDHSLDFQASRFPKSQVNLGNDELFVTGHCSMGIQAMTIKVLSEIIVQVIRKKAK